MTRVNQILKEYESLREKSRARQEERKKEVYKRIPRLGKIENEMIEIGILIARSVFQKDIDKKKTLEELEGRQNSLKAEKKDILMSNDYPANYLELEYQCKECQDTGFNGLEKCSCFFQKRIKYNYLQSNLSKIIERENFDSFNLDYYSDKIQRNGITSKKNMRHVYLECINYAKEFDNHNKNLLFIGKPGLGKTFLCHSISKELLREGKTVIYYSASDLMDTVRKYQFSFDDDKIESQSLQDIYKSDLLLIDDIGTELSTRFSNLVIYNVLNKRLQYSKKMIISTNLDVNELLEFYSERITSRIFGNFHMFEFFGEDIRILKNMD